MVVVIAFSTLLALSIMVIPSIDIGLDQSLSMPQVSVCLYFIFFIICLFPSKLGLTFTFSAYVFLFIEHVYNICIFLFSFFIISD